MMLRFTQIYRGDEPPALVITLSFDQRVKSRQKVELDNGSEAGLFLTRGTILQQGDCLLAETNEIVKIIAASETVSTAYISDPLMMARCSYHLGNRHVPLQITQDFIRYQHDHVLDEMLIGLGVTVTVESAPFEPEAGAYGSNSHAHSHEHDNSVESHGHAH